MDHGGNSDSFEQENITRKGIREESWSRWRFGMVCWLCSGGGPLSFGSGTARLRPVPRRHWPSGLRRRRRLSVGCKQVHPCTGGQAHGMSRICVPTAEVHPFDGLLNALRGFEIDADGCPRKKLRA